MVVKDLLWGRSRSYGFISTHACGVRPLRLVLQHSGQAEVWHFALQGGVHQDVASSQVSVNVTHFREVLHACSDAAQHPHQLEWQELAVVVLPGQQKSSLVVAYEWKYLPIQPNLNNNYRLN